MTASLRRFAALLTLILTLSLAVCTLTSAPAHAAVMQPAMSSATLGDRMLNWAEYHATGHWYGWGGTGPSVYDCSGLVYAAARADGLTLPRTTYGMLAGSSHLYRISLSSIRRGDLLFFGSGHVEINTGWWHTSFGAHNSGTRVGWRSWNSYYAPTMAMRLR